MSNLFDLSEISGWRRHVYVYALLILIPLTVSAYRRSHPPKEVDCKALRQEIARMLEMEAIARDLY